MELKRLEKRLEDLIVTVTQIKEENRALRQRQKLDLDARVSCKRTNRFERGSKP